MAGARARVQHEHLEPIDHVLLALDARICDGAHFLALEVLPAVAVEALVEREDGLRVDHVDESVAFVAVVLEVDGQVKEVIKTLASEVRG